LSGSGCGFEGDFVAEGFEVTDVVALGSFVDHPRVVEPRGEVDEPGFGLDSRCQAMVRMDPSLEHLKMVDPDRSSFNIRLGYALGSLLRHDGVSPFGRERVRSMPRYLWQISYTTAGAKGLLSEGGTSRRNAITAMVESVGGHVEVCYYAFGTTDLYVIGEVPDEVAAASLSLRTAVAGAARSQTVVLLTAEQLDEAARRDVSYRPPGEG
jgi:uncharacterized protein with GYD domain